MMAGGPERIQTDDGPPWATASVSDSRMLNHDLREALGLVVKLQHDIGVDRNILLEQLRLLARGRVDDAQALVAAAQDGGGAHGKLAFLYRKFESQVLIEVHDLLLQLTRPDQVSMVLHLLEAQFTEDVDLVAIRQLCGTDEPETAHRRLTDQGMMLWQLLLRADLLVRSAGHAVFLEERMASLQSAGASPSLLASMQSAGSGSPSLGFRPRPQGPPYRPRLPRLTRRVLRHVTGRLLAPDGGMGLQLRPCVVAR